MTWRRQPEAVHAGAALGAVAVVTVVLGRWLEVSNASVASTTLNFFFLPPGRCEEARSPSTYFAIVIAGPV
jgi:hypothetical protein